MSSAGCAQVNGQNMVRKQEDITIAINMRNLNKREIKKYRRMKIQDKQLKMNLTDICSTLKDLTIMIRLRNMQGH